MVHRASDQNGSVEDLHITISDVAAPADQDALRDALYEFNYRTTQYRDGRSLSCFLRAEDGQLIAGIDGFTWGGYGRIEHLWVSEPYRGCGIGSQLLAAAEEARARGCATIVLDTHSFQAPDFYRQREYVEIGVTRETPRGHSQLLFQKFL